MYIIAFQLKRITLFSLLIIGFCLSTSSHLYGQIDIKITDPDDDVEEDISGINCSSADLDFEPGNLVGLLYKNIGIQGQIVQGATIRFHPDASNSEFTVMRIFAQLINDAPDFNCTNSTDVSSRNRTTNYVEWTVPPWVNNDRISSPNIDAVLNEVVTLPGFTVNSDIVIILETLVGYRRAESYDTDGNDADTPKLEIISTSVPFCGDGFCTSGETSANCPGDCGSVCGDGVCNGSESSVDCPGDCGTNCGDGVCNGSENANNCNGDCPSICGDGFCTSGETSATCPGDCGSVCGDGVCNGGESSATCPGDCGSVCGDGVCNGSESSVDCPGDCGSVCGDGACNGSETTANCFIDCGTNCGDGVCNGPENASNCQADCPSVCGDGFCTSGEDSSTCPGDCPCLDNDNDNICDDVDLDDDNDGCIDTQDPNPLVADPDTDMDAIADPCDNCVLIPNNDQIDSDGDGLGDACDDNPDQGIGINTDDPLKSLHIKNGTLYIDDAYKGIILKGKDGFCYRLTISEQGALEAKKIFCPVDPNEKN